MCKKFAFLICLLLNGDYFQRQEQQQYLYNLNYLKCKVVGSKKVKFYSKVNKKFSFNGEVCGEM